MLNIISQAHCKTRVRVIVEDEDGTVFAAGRHLCVFRESELVETRDLSGNDLEGVRESQVISMDMNSNNLTTVRIGEFAVAQLDVAPDDVRDSCYCQKTSSLFVLTHDDLRSVNIENGKSDLLVTGLRESDGIGRYEELDGRNGNIVACGDGILIWSNGKAAYLNNDRWYDHAIIDASGQVVASEYRGGLHWIETDGVVSRQEDIVEGGNYFLGRTANQIIVLTQHGPTVTGTVVSTQGIHTSKLGELHVWCAAVDCDNQRVFIGTEDGSVITWSLKGDNCSHIMLPGDSGAVTQVHWSERTELLYVGTKDGTVYVAQNGGE
jgi:WD40 repeat protein